MIATYQTLYAGDYMTRNWQWRACGLDPLIEGMRSIGGIATVHKTDTAIRFWLEVSW